MQATVLAVLAILAYAMVLLFCAVGSVIAGLLARRCRRQMLIEIDPTRFQALENGFNQAFVVSVTLATFMLVLLAFVPTVLRDLKVVL